MSVILLIQYFAGGKIERVEMGGACGAYERGERCVQDSGGENLMERDHWGDPDVDGRIILSNIGCSHTTEPTTTMYFN
jgi:hypothetical protein